MVKCTPWQRFWVYILYDRKPLKGLNGEFTSSKRSEKYYAGFCVENRLSGKLIVGAR